jgi:hypothetical protein
LSRKKLHNRVIGHNKQKAGIEIGGFGADGRLIFIYIDVIFCFNYALQPLVCKTETFGG